jgi:glutathione S-transferase
MMPPEPAAPLTVVSFLGGFGQPSLSPFCSKVAGICAMLGVPCTLEVASGPPKSSTGKLPYLRLPDGGFVEGSDAIVDWLRTERGLDPDAGLPPRERAVSQLARRTIEEHVYFGILFDRWVQDSGFPFVQEHYFGGLPPVVRSLVPHVIRRQVRRDVQGQGLSRMTEAQITHRIGEDLDSLVALLGDRDWYLSERPTQLDAVSWAFLASAAAVPAPGIVTRAVQERPALVAHGARFAAAFDLSGTEAPSK